MGIGNICPTTLPGILLTILVGDELFNCVSSILCVPLLHKLIHFDLLLLSFFELL